MAFNYNPCQPHKIQSTITPAFIKKIRIEIAFPIMFCVPTDFNSVFAIEEARVNYKNIYCMHVDIQLDIYISIDIFVYRC